MQDNDFHVIITGTDPESRKGGIGFALPGYLAAFEASGVTTEVIPSYHPEYFGGSWLWWIRAMPRLWSAIRKAKRANKKVVLYGHAGSGISLFREGFLLAIGRSCGVHTIMQLHSVEVDSYLKSFFPSIMFRLVISQASAISVLTPWWKHRLLEAGIKKKIFVIPNPLPSAWELKARGKVNKHVILGEKKISIIAMSRIEPGKGLDLLIEAMQYVPENMLLTIAGDGSQTEHLKLKVLELGLKDKVIFAGWVDGSEKQQLLDSADIFCLPSTYDSFGMGFLEAMANSLPVIALNQGATPDVVPNGVAGILIDEHQPKQLSEALIMLIDSCLRKQMGGHGQSWVLKEYAAHKVGEELHRMIESVFMESTGG